MYFVVCVHLGQNFSLVNISQGYTTETTPSLSTVVAVKSCYRCGCCCGSIFLNPFSAVEDHSKVDRNRNRNRTATATATKTATAFRALG